jgi:hypothetical protein
MAIWKRLTVGLAAGCLLLGLAACGSTSLSSSGSAPEARAARLARGTLNLEGTAQAVDQQTATSLLPLWQLVDELSTRSAAAPQEMTAVLDQIQATMTQEQLSAMAAMNLKEVALTDAGSAGGASAVPTTTGASPMLTGAGDPGMMGMLEGGGAPPGGGGPTGGTSSQRSSRSAAQAQAAASGSSATLIQEVIQLLEQKIKT